MLLESNTNHITGIAPATVKQLLDRARRTGLTAATAAQILYGTTVPNAQQRRAALDVLAGLAKSGRLVRKHTGLAEHDAVTNNYRGRERVGGIAAANADRDGVHRCQCPDCRKRRASNAPTEALGGAR